MDLFAQRNSIFNSLFLYCVPHLSFLHEHAPSLHFSFYSSVSNSFSLSLILSGCLSLFSSIRPLHYYVWYYLLTNWRDQDQLYQEKHGKRLKKRPHPLRLLRRYLGHFLLHIMMHSPQQRHRRGSIHWTFPSHHVLLLSFLNLCRPNFCRPSCHGNPGIRANVRRYKNNWARGSKDPSLRAPAWHRNSEIWTSGE